MPLHLNSITNDSQNSGVLAWILQTALNNSGGVFCTEDKRYLHLAQLIRDEKTGKDIGRFIFTLFNNETEKRLEGLDVDIVLDNGQTSELQFLKRLPASSDSNEYYEVESSDQGQHLLIETVNRYTVAEDLEGESRLVRACAFPFELSVYETMDALNKWAGFDKLKEVGKTGMRVGGFSPHFTAPGGIFNHKDDSEFSFVVGRVETFEDVTVQFGEHTYDFSIIWLDTALGVIPVAASREVFDLSILDTGKIVAMNADIKVDFADYAEWHWHLE